LAHGRSAARTAENSCPDNRAASTGNIGRIAVVLDGMDLTDVQWAVLEPIFRPPVLLAYRSFLVYKNQLALIRDLTWRAFRDGSGAMKRGRS
jgi:hypothetical protein